MEDDMIDVQVPNRGKALLVISMIIVSTTFAFLIVPRTFLPPQLTVRVAIIDSGITKDNLLTVHTVAEASFVNSTYGYSMDDLSTDDSKPHSLLHGTYVARITVQQAPNTAIVNAKVVNSDNVATVESIIAAIQWAILEQDCEVINLSLGKSPSNSDGMREIIEWAFQQGVTIVAASGNNAQGGITGSSIESPAVYPEVISVAAIDDTETPYSYSGIGPSVNRSMKPDIAAPGYFIDSTTTFHGTSAAAPFVTGAAVNIINYCLENNWKWTPGMIKAALLASTKHLSYPAWQVGAGLLDQEAAMAYLESTEKVDGLPMMAWISPDLGIFEFERWFLNTTVRLKASVFASKNSTFTILISGPAKHWIAAPDIIFVNQSYEIQIQIKVISSIDWTNMQALITLQSEDYRTIWSSIKFGVTTPFRRIAFDFTHTSWWMDSIYGQFRQFYSRIASSGVSVEEIRDRKDISFDKFKQFDAVIILDPCAWEFSETGETSIPYSSTRYSQDELDAYGIYWQKGGNIMIAAGNNLSMDVEGVNALLAVFDMSLNFDTVPTSTIVTYGVANTVEVVNIEEEHAVTERIYSFDYNGASINPGENQTVLAQEVFQWIDDVGTTHTALRPVLVVQEGRLSSRLIVTGSNFFIDNWGLSGAYESEDNSLMMRNCIYWLTHVPGF
ncbi:MAG: S8 family serine peptidase [Candidatus Thorarchaeota archaeon]|nr:S8 family serine peptidase [Candidatus Thorarchaeota archaeon]